MSDYLVTAATNPVLRKALSALALPTPHQLLRAGGACKENFLEGRRVLFGSACAGKVQGIAEDVLGGTGARVVINPSQQPGPDDEFDALVFDATGMERVSQLKSLYEFFHPVARKLAGNGRVVVLASLPDAMETVAARTAARAVEGFTRSYAKEIGKFGSTVNLLYVEPGAENRIEAPMRFFLSRHSAFVDGQVLSVTAGGRVPDVVPKTRLLTGKTALVTGGAHGIGAATAARLAAEGAHVVCLDISSEHRALEATVAEFGGTALTLDITGQDAPRQVGDFLENRFEGVDIVIHNAGITRDKTLANMPEDYWDAVLAINLEAILAIDAELVERHIINDHGRVVCLCSIGGIAGNRGQTNYGMTKAGLIGFVQGRSNTERDRGVTVNAVAPGFIETRMTAGMPLATREAGRRLSSLGQGGLPEDVAEAITFLSSPGAGGISGNVLRVCGQSLLGA